MITIDATAIPENGQIPNDIIEDVLKEHDALLARLGKLEEYAFNKSAITKRQRQSGLPNNRLSNAFPRYIATMASGYLIGNPVTYKHDTQAAPLEGVLDKYRAYDADSVDSELAMQASIFGKGVEVLFVGDDAQARSAPVSPLSSFVVYDDTVKNAPVFAVRRWEKKARGDSAATKRVDVYTKSSIYHYKGRAGSTNALDLIDFQSHFFEGIPVIEYWNNAEERGDFESVMSLIDAYDGVQSDRVNDKQQFTDSIMVAKGIAEFAQAEDDEDKRTPAQRLNEDKLAMLPDNTTSLEWLMKPLNQGDTEILKDSLKSDIHKFSMVPDLTDLQFAGNSSGVAMRFKLLGLEQLTKIKERWFREGLRSRLRLFAKYQVFKGGEALDADNVQLVFTRSLPANDAEIAQMVAGLQGIVPNKILLTQLPFVGDTDEAEAALQKEKEAAIEARQKMISGSDYVSAFGRDEEA